jgi:hypothetical protein
MRAYVLTMPKEKTKPDVAGVGTVRLNLTISESLEREFRETVFKRYGLHKGDIQRAVEEAIKLWIKGV